MGISVGTAVVLIKEAIPLIKSFIKPKTLGKEGSAIAVYLTGQEVVEQYLECGVECVQGDSVAALVAALWVLGVTAYTKYSKVKQAK